MSNKFSSNKEYSTKKTTKWWEKDIDPTISFIFLFIAIIAVFVMGAVFMKEYTNIWTKISQREKQAYSIDQIKNLEQIEKDIQFKDIVIP